MADQKRWFKVWTSILLDPAMNSMDLADMGRWVRLGALAAAVGEHGRLVFPAGGDGLIMALRVPDLASAKCALLRLPHVSFEEGTNDNGEFTVIISNWYKYQEDATGYERLKRSRSKRREDKEKTKRRKETLSLALSQPELKIPPSILTALDQTVQLGQVPRLRTIGYWQANIRATNGHVEYAQEILKAEAWLMANPSRAPRKDLARFLNNWLSRAGERG